MDISICSLYKLERDPFEPGVTNPLCPFTNQIHQKFYADVKGFAQKRSEFDRFPLDKPRHLRILVFGDEQTGRTSVVNYAAHCYAVAHGHADTPYRKILVNLSESADPLHAVRRTMKKWIEQIEDDLRASGREDQGASLYNKFDEIIDRSGEIANKTASLNRFIRNSLLHDYSQVTGKHILLIERVKNKIQMDCLLTVMEHVPFLAITTDQEEVCEGFKQSLRGLDPPTLPIVVSLSQIDGHDIQTLIEQRWKAAGGRGQHPFQELEEVFSSYPPIPIVLALLFLEKVMLERGEQVQSQKDDDQQESPKIEITREFCESRAWRYKIRLS